MSIIVIIIITISVAAAAFTLRQPLLQAFEKNLLTKELFPISFNDTIIPFACLNLFTLTLFFNMFYTECLAYYKGRISPSSLFSDIQHPEKRAMSAP